MCIDLTIMPLHRFKIFFSPNSFFRFIIFHIYEPVGGLFLFKSVLGILAVDQSARTDRSVDHHFLEIGRRECG